MGPITPAGAGLQPMVGAANRYRSPIINGTAQRFNTTNLPSAHSLHGTPPMGFSSATLSPVVPGIGGAGAVNGATVLGASSHYQQWGLYVNIIEEAGMHAPCALCAHVCIG